jgi:predicted component of type VI protein secretion system
VLSGGVDRGSAVAVNQILNTRARLIEIERKVKETEELEERIEQLEQAQEQKRDKRWGA